MTRKAIMTTADHHTRAADELRAAVRHINDALRYEDGLEWSGQLHDLQTDAVEIEVKLREYARRAAAPTP